MFDFKSQPSNYFIDDNGFAVGQVEIPGGSPISVKIVKDSITDDGSRLITWCWEYPRMIHAEIMTHRALSRNSASSRAIPAGSLRRRTENAPATPIYWGQNQKGMQANQELEGDALQDACNWWRHGLALMSEHHAHGEALGLHKQIVNRVIEPWMVIAVVVSTTDHANLFHQRKHHAAEPHFQCIANLAWELFHNHMPTYVAPGGWHLPYVDTGIESLGSLHPPTYIDVAKKVSTARCARVSYLTHEGKRDAVEDIRLHDDLASTIDADEPGHFSPFEHPAMAVGKRERHANFEGWKSYRQFFPKQAGPDTSDRCGTCGCWAGNHVLGCGMTNRGDGLA